MSFLSPEILLMIAERADMSTISAMTQTSKATCGLIMEYQGSVVKHKLATSSILFPPSGAILSSATYTERKILEPHTFYITQELERRQFRINALLEDEASVLLNLIIKDDKACGFLPERETQNLIAGFKHAAMILDRLGDSCVDGLCAVKSTEDDALVRRQSHLAQLDLILHRLTSRELAFLSTFVDFCVQTYAKLHPYAQEDPAPWVRLTSFREALMRNGTLIIWAWLENALAPASGIVTTSPTPTELTEKIIEDTLVEIEEWEEGPRAEDERDFHESHLKLPSLYTSVRDAFAKHTGRNVKRAWNDMEVEVLVAIKEDNFNVSTTTKAAET
ncbi:hypothetical protein OQA88_5736 [Cercophora sp. LCS_1]